MEDSLRTAPAVVFLEEPELLRMGEDLQACEVAARAWRAVTGGPTKNHSKLEALPITTGLEERFMANRHKQTISEV